MELTAGNAKGSRKSLLDVRRKALARLAEKVLARLTKKALASFPGALM